MADIQPYKLSHLRGDTFRLSLTVRNDGVPTDITGWSVDAQVYSGSKIIATPEFEMVDAASGQYSLVVYDTDDWPTGALTMALRYHLPGGDKIGAPPFYLDVQKGLVGV